MTRLDRFDVTMIRWRESGGTVWQRVLRDGQIVEEKVDQ